jgi:hypothetical protein
VFRIPAYKFISAEGNGATSVIAPRYTVTAKVSVVACDCESTAFCDDCMCRKQLRLKRAAGDTGTPPDAAQLKKRWMCSCCKHLFCLDDSHGGSTDAHSQTKRNARYVPKAQCRECVRARGCRRSRSRTNGHVVTTTQARASQSAAYATLRTGVFFVPGTTVKDMKDAILLEYEGHTGIGHGATPAQQNAATGSPGVSADDPERTTNRERAAAAAEQRRDAPRAKLPEERAGLAPHTDPEKSPEQEFDEPNRGAFAAVDVPVIELLGPTERRSSPRLNPQNKFGFV